MGVAEGTKIFEVHLDAKTGEQVKTQNEDLSAVAQALKVTLPQAIEAALLLRQGNSVDVEAVTGGASDETSSS